MEYQLFWEDIGERGFVVEIDSLCWFEWVLPLMKHEKVSSLYWYENKKAGAYYSSEDITNEGEAGFHFYRKQKSLETVVGIMCQVKAEVDQFIYLMKKTQLQSLEDAKIILLLRSYHQLYKRALGSHYLSQPQLFPLLEKEIQKQVKNQEEYIGLTTSTRFSALQRQEIGLIQLAREIQNCCQGKRCKKHTGQLRKIKETYSLYAAGQAHPPWGLPFYDDKLNTYLTQKPKILKEKLLTIQKTKKSLEKKQRMLEAKLPKKTSHLCKVIRELSWYRFDVSRIAWTSCMYIGQPILHEIARRRNILIPEIEHALLGELEHIMVVPSANKKLLAELKKREQCFCYLLEGRKATMYAGTRGKKVFHKKIQEQSFDHQEIKGHTANRGKVQGKVRVFSNENADLKEMISAVQQDEILIVQNTWPQLLPACAKAKAIVTNEGGIACHAAILSRELGIPCIVGTRYATKTFNTGEYVEVDANEGIIRKIQKND